LIILQILKRKVIVSLVVSIFCYQCIGLTKAWTENEIIRIFKSYKKHGTKWSLIINEFPGRTENEIKNKFYTTLRRVATRAQLEDPVKYDSSFIKCKSNLLQFVDAAIEYSHTLPSKRGRKQRDEMRKAKQNAFVVSKSQEVEIKTEVVDPIEISPQQEIVQLKRALEIPVENHYMLYALQTAKVQYMYLNLINPYIG